MKTYLGISLLAVILGNASLFGIETESFEAPFTANLIMPKKAVIKVGKKAEVLMEEKYEYVLRESYVLYSPSNEVDIAFGSSLYDEQETLTEYKGMLSFTGIRYRKGRIFYFHDDRQTYLAYMKNVMSPQDQMSRRLPGATTHEAVLKKDKVSSAEDRKPFCKLFPMRLAPLMPYLDGLFYLGNTCKEEADFLYGDDSISDGAQIVKTALSRYGVTYTMNYDLNYAGITGGLRPEGKRDFASQNGSIRFNINLLRFRDSGGVFFSPKVVFGDGFGFNESMRNPQKSLGSLENPATAMNSQGCFMTQAALGISGFERKSILMVGQIDAGNYLDANAYSNFRSNNMNHSAFDNNSVIAFTSSFGYLLAVQPCDSFYMMVLSASNNTPANHNPFDYISGEDWSTIGEFGFIFDTVGTMGKGIYRLMPFFVTTQGESGAGIAVNIQQLSSPGSTLGYYFRAGYADADASSLSGVRASVACGMALMSSTKDGNALNGDYVGLGLLWMQGAKSGRPYSNANEFGIEMTRVYQFTPTMVIQPDIQLLHNPAHGRNGQTNVIFQIQTRWNF